MTGDRDELAARVAGHGRVAQGFPPYVEDEGVLLEAALLLVEGDNQAPMRPVPEHEGSEAR